MGDEKRLNEAEAALRAAEAALDDLRARLASTEAEAARARAKLAASLEGVALDRLVAEAAKHAEAQRQADAADLAAVELRRRIALAEGEVKRARGYHGVVMVETKQAALDQQSRDIVVLLQQALQALQAQRREEQWLIERYATPRVTFGSGFIEVIRHKLETVERELK
jgi:hypothetical protein